MKLLAFIDLLLKSEPAGKSVSSRDKDAACRAALEAYLHGGDCDIRRAVLTEFLLGFGMFLARTYEKGYSAATNREILRTLRKWLRVAIHEGYVPNIDAVPAVIARLDAEAWPEAKPEKSRRAMAARQELKIRESADWLARSLDSWATRQTMGLAARGTDREARARALQARCAAIYLFCLLTGGIEIRDALAIRRDWDGRAIPDDVYVERFGARLPLPQAAKRLVELYNRGTMPADHLFATLDNGKYSGDADKAVRLVEGHAASHFRREALPLYRQRSVFTDWLDCAIEGGLPADEAEALWRRHLDGEHGAPACCAAPSGYGDSRLAETWYLLSLIPLSVKRERFISMLTAAGILGDAEESARRIYAPEERARQGARHGQAVFRRYLFIRATPVQAEFANGFSPYAYVLRDRATGRFAQIREAEIRHLQVMLRDFPDAVELVDGARWLAEHNAEILEGCKAVIRSGSLAGKEATVVRVKGRASGKPTYIIEYVEGTLRFQTDLDGIQLDLVPAP